MTAAADWIAGGLTLMFAASWVGLLCLVVAILSAIAYRESARTGRGMEGDQ